jgi:uncharacterized SAM-binding protein YcdF (DUF218 family)
MSEHYSKNNLHRRASVIGNGGRRFVRILLLFTLAMQALSYLLLTHVRYEGQGLAPIYFRVTTLSDIVSFLFSFIIVAFLLLALRKPERIGSARAIIVAILSGTLLWIDFGIRHTSPEEFTPEAAIAVLLAMFLLLALLFAPSPSAFGLIRRMLRVVRNVMTITALMLFIALMYGLFFTTYSTMNEIADFHADAGVVLGAAVWHGNGLGERPSPALRERIDLGHELLIHHAIPRIVVTGGSAPGKLAEAEVARIELLRLGVDSSQIIEENTSHTTFEQVRFLRDDLFQKHGWSRFVIVSDQYHLARVCEMCRFNGLTVIGSPSHIHEPFLDIAYYRLRESVAMLEYWFLCR